LRELRAQTLRRGSLQGVTSEWVAKLKRASATLPPEALHVAERLYCGRAVAECVNAAEIMGANLAFISAGLGVVPRGKKIPSYGLTSSLGHPDSVIGRTEGGVNAASWWDALATAMKAKHPIAKFVSKSRARLVLIAMSGPYLKMIASDLASLSTRNRRKLRIIGPRRLKDVPDALQAQWMPYDARLDARKSAYRGTEADFPHRALLHFTHRILRKHARANSDDHSRKVRSSLAPFKANARSRGKSVTDEELVPVLRDLWSRHGGRRSAMLRDLRDNSGFACEQKRFQGLIKTYEGSLRAAN